MAFKTRVGFCWHPLVILSFFIAVIFFLIFIPFPFVLALVCVHFQILKAYIEIIHFRHLLFNLWFDILNFSQVLFVPYFMYSLYILIAALFLPAHTDPSTFLLLWEDEDVPFIFYQPIQAHQVTTGLGTSSPTAKTRNPSEVVRIHRLATQSGTIPAPVGGEPALTQSYISAKYVLMCVHV